MPNDHECPADGCAARIPYGFLACRTHWRRVPPELARMVWSTWRRRLQVAGRSPGTPEHLSAIEAHQAAADAAIAAINAPAAEGGPTDAAAR